MLALTWVTLLFATGISESVQSNDKTCDGKTFTITLKPTNQIAAAGRCVVLECSFENNVTSFTWSKNNQSGEGKTPIFNSSTNTSADSGIMKRVSLLEPDVKKKNCSIIIKNLTTSDTGVYQVTAIDENGCTHVSEANITVEVQEINITLEMTTMKNITCSVPAFCSGSKPQFTWIYQEAAEKDNLTITNNTEFMIIMMNDTQSHKSSLIFNASAKLHNIKVTCRVNFTCNILVEKTLNMNQNQNIFSHLVELLKAKMIPVLIVFGVGFLIGSLVTTLIACLATKCRSKKKSPHSTDELELLNPDAAFKDDGTLVFQDDGIQNQAAAECGEEICGDLVDLDMSPKESVYSDIDFSALKEKNPADAKEKEDTTETEYAEIKRGEMEVAQENEEMGCEILVGNYETEVMIEHQEEANQIVVAEEVIGEADQLYYNKEVMDENCLIIFVYARKKKSSPRESLELIEMFILTWLILLFISSSSGMNGNLTLMIPLLIEGQETTLTCTADLCSNDETPVFEWKWTTSMENNSFNINNATESQKQNSTVTFKPSAKHHGSAVTCQVTCPNNITANVRKVLNVTYVKKLEIRGEKTIKDGDTLNLTCHFDGFPQTLLIWTKLGSNTSITNGTGAATLFISNVTGMDSGQYICTALHQNRNRTVDVEVQYEKKLKITGETMLKEGDTLNLTCTGSIFPSSIIMWTKSGRDTPLINETQTDISRSTLVVPNVTAEDSGKYFCTAKHLNNTLTESVDVLVKTVWEMKITGETTVREESALNLTCSVESIHPLQITWTKLGMNKTLTNDTGITVGTSSLIIQNVTTSNSGQYFCTTKFPTSQTQDINVTVTYRRSPKITGDVVVTEGDVLNLTCSVDSWPLSLITWTKSRSSTVLKNDTGSATLLIFNATAEANGLYICTSEHLNINITKEVHIKVKKQPQILDKSGCKSQQNVLTCVCISQGFPSPTITWEPLENHVDYSINTVVSNHTVTSTLSMNMKGFSNVSAVCISSNINGKTSRTLSIIEVEDEGHITNYLWTFTQKGIIIPFFIGVLVSTFIFSLLWLCCSRKKHKSDGSTSETLEMAMTQETNGCQTVDYEPIPVRGTAAGSNGTEAGTSDIEYSDIHLLIKQDDATPSEKKPKKEVTEYAKIKPKKESKMEKGEGREEEKEMKLCVPEDAESETVAVYSNVTKLKDQM
ncbi:uncharacterized protein LOC129370854 [Poeciliopsis prolifica]|nr:uncharacterized protein LOC129370854 [Poeciliopsis prolifica]